MEPVPPFGGALGVTQSTLARREPPSEASRALEALAEGRQFPEPCPGAQRAGG